MNLSLRTLLSRSATVCLSLAGALPLHAQLTTPVATRMGAGDTFAVLISESGDLWSIGSSTTGALGLETVNQLETPTQIITTGRTWIDVAVGDDFVLAIADDHTLWGWGANAEGQLGDGTTTNRSVPTRIGTRADWADVEVGEDFAVALTTGGAVYGWGSNSNAQLLRSTLSVPVRTPTLLNGTFNDSTTTLSSVKVRRISAGAAHVIAIDEQGRLLGWGNNTAGELGSPSIPKTNIQKVQVIDASRSWSQVEATSLLSFAIDSTGSLYVFGTNTLGQAGLANTNIASPTRVPLPAGVVVAHVDASASHTVVVTSTGDVYGWGANLYPYGQLGIDVVDDFDMPITGNMFFTSPQNLKTRTFSDATYASITQRSFDAVAVGPDYTLVRSGENFIYGTGKNSGNVLGMGNGVGFELRNAFVRLPFGIPDLRIKAVNNDTTDPKISKTLNLTLTLENIGSASLRSNSNVAIRAYISRDAQFDDDDIALPLASGLNHATGSLKTEAIRFNQSLGGSNSQIVEMTAGLPESLLSANTYYLIFTVNEDTAPVEESNYDNNELILTEPLTFQADLQITPTLISTGSFTSGPAGDDLIIDYALKNQGSAPVAANTFTIKSFYVYLGEESTVLGPDPDRVVPNTSITVNQQLLPDGVITGRFTTKLPTLSYGFYRAGLIVDPDNKVIETNEENNRPADTAATAYFSVVRDTSGSNDLKGGLDLQIIAGPTSPDGETKLKYEDVTFIPGGGAQWVNTTDVDVVTTAPNSIVTAYPVVSPNNDILMPPLDLTSGSTASFSLTVTGPIVVEFNWGIAAATPAAGQEESNDTLTFTVDGALPLGYEGEAQLSGNQGWRHYRQLIEPSSSPRVLKWTYKRGTGAPSVYAFVDQMRLQEETRPDLTVESVAYNSQDEETFILLRDQYLDVVVNGINIGGKIPTLTNPVPGTGNGDTNQFNAEVRLSKDKIWGNTDDVLLGTLEQIQNIDGNGRYIYGQNFDMNFCFPGGEYYLAVYVDSTKRYREINDETLDQVRYDQNGWPIYVYTTTTNGTVANVDLFAQVIPNTSDIGIKNPFVTTDTYLKITNLRTGEVEGGLPSGIRLQYVVEDNNNIWFSDTADIIVESRPFIQVENVVYRPGMFYREDEFPVSFEAVNVGCEDVPPGEIITIKVGLRGYNDSRKGAIVQGGDSLGATTPDHNREQSLDRNLGTVTDNRGISRGSRVPYSGSFRVPRYNESEVIEGFTPSEPLENGQEYVRQKYPSWGLSVENDIFFPVGYLPSSSANQIGALDALSNPWPIDTVGESFLNPNNGDDNGLLWDRFFFPSSAANDEQPYSILFTRNPVVLSLTFETTCTIPVVWDIVTQPGSPEPAVIVDVTARNQTYMDWRTFWNLQREFGEFYTWLHGPGYAAYYRTVPASPYPNGRTVFNYDPSNDNSPLEVVDANFDYVGDRDGNPDGDQFTNAQEWAFVSSPLHADPLSAIISTDIVTVDGPGGNNGGVDDAAYEYLQVTFNALSDHSNSEVVYEVWASNDLNQLNLFTEDDATGTIRLFRYDPRVLDISGSTGGVITDEESVAHLRARNGVVAIINNGYSYRITVRDNQTISKGLDGQVDRPRFLTVRARFISQDAELQAEANPFNAGTPDAGIDDIDYAYDTVP